MGEIVFKLFILSVGQAIFEYIFEYFLPSLLFGFLYPILEFVWWSETSLCDKKAKTEEVFKGADIFSPPCSSSSRSDVTDGCFKKCFWVLVSFSPWKICFYFHSSSCFMSTLCILFLETLKKFGKMIRTSIVSLFSIGCTISE